MKQREYITLLGGAVVAWTLAGAFAPDVARIAVAQNYPSRPINVIVSFPPGGNTDIMARALQNEMSKALSQTVVIINKPGAAGTLGLIELSRAAPDGYTIALTPNNPLTAQPHVQKLPYVLDSFRYSASRPWRPGVSQKWRWNGAFLIMVLPQADAGNAVGSVGCQLDGRWCKNPFSMITGYKSQTARCTASPRTRAL